MSTLSRRQFLKTSAYATAGTGLMLNTSSALSAADTPARYLDMNDPTDALTAMVKMKGSLEPVDCPHWYTGTIYAMLPGKQPVALIDYEGSEIDFYERQEDGSYHAYGATVSYFRDTNTGKLIDVWENPITGKKVEVQPNTINVKAHYIYSIYGMKRSDDPTPFSAAPMIHKKFKWWESGEYTWLNTKRQVPKTRAYGEDQLIQGLTSELFDPDLPSVKTTATPTYMSTWLPWMGMQGIEGHTVWTGPAHKLESVKQYPKYLLDKIEKDFPNKLTAKPG